MTKVYEVTEVFKVVGPNDDGDQETLGYFFSEEEAEKYADKNCRIEGARAVVLGSGTWFKIEEIDVYPDVIAARRAKALAKLDPQERILLGLEK